MTGRIGWFFFIVGSVLLLIFFASDLAKQTSYQYLCLGMLAVVFGIILWNNGREPAKPSGRFNTLRKMGESSKKPRKPKSKTTPPG